jgi:hypothetical protein
MVVPKGNNTPELLATRRRTEKCRINGKPSHGSHHGYAGSVKCIGRYADRSIQKWTCNELTTPRSRYFVAIISKHLLVITAFVSKNNY